MQVRQKQSIIETFCFDWRKQYYELYFTRKQEFEVKNVLMMDLFLTNMQLFTSQDINWWTGGDCDVFISCLDSHSDGTHSLQSIYCWTSDEMQNFPKSVQSSSKNALWVCLCGYLLSGWISSNVWDVLPPLLSSDKPLENVTKEFGRGKKKSNFVVVS